MASSFLRKDTFLLLEGSEMRKASNAGVGEGWPHYFLFGMGCRASSGGAFLDPGPEAAGFWSFQTRLEIFTGQHRITSSSAD
ncbi:hypothetical protein CEP52_007908 [Fusarium oligoseptatum]|uniref:Uncharacterized protein n=1 Tax=Fusarium oligoseptatum TaxID=2604345 RepID=A0A428TKP6_9HYPO|nr:hypothetical protein CEP52_007908 [Fusarium oligoseptatum]